MEAKSKMWASIGISVVGTVLVATGSPIAAGIVIVFCMGLIWQ